MSQHGWYVFAPLIPSSSYTMVFIICRCTINYSDTVACSFLCFHLSSTDCLRLRSRFQSCPIFYHPLLPYRQKKSSNTSQQHFAPLNICFLHSILINIQEPQLCERQSSETVQSNGGTKKRRKADGCWRMRNLKRPPRWLGWDLAKDQVARERMMSHCAEARRWHCVHFMWVLHLVRSGASSP